MGQYDDILHLPHHVSDKHPPMSMIDRAAQFSPFAALTGYDAAIDETARWTDARRELTEEQQQHIGALLHTLKNREKDLTEVMVTYFVQDRKKPGGSYLTVRGQLKKIDEHAGVLTLRDGMSIPFDDILSLEEAGNHK